LKALINHFFISSIGTDYGNVVIVTTLSITT